MSYSRRSFRKEIIKILYEKLSQEIRILEKNFISLLIGLISSLGVYIYGLQAYLKSMTVENWIFFSVTTSLSILISLIIFYASNIFAYTHRVNQVILSIIESSLSFYEPIDGFLPQQWNLYRKVKSCNKIEPPEIYKLFRFFSIIFIVFSLISYFFILIYSFLKEGDPLINFSKIICFFIIIIFILIVIFLTNKFIWREYLEKIKSLSKNHNQ